MDPSKDPVYQFREAASYEGLGVAIRRKNSLYENTKHFARFSERIKWKPLEGDIFERKFIVGKGTYAQVYRAHALNGDGDVAVKQFSLSNQKEGFPITAIREIQILQSLHHMNIVQLLDVITSRGIRLLGHKNRKGHKPLAHVDYKDVQIYMIFEYLDHDLAGLIYNPKVELTLGNVKFIIQEILEALRFLHDECRLMHRDVKGSNVLISHDGDVKLGDFGLAREMDIGKGRFTNRVVTLWYRAPELLLGSFTYDEKVDMWSVGCIVAEMLIGSPLFFAHQEVKQMEEICKICGTPTEENWPHFKKIMTDAVRIDPRRKGQPTAMPRKIYPRNLEDTILLKRPELSKVITNAGWDMLEGLLTLNPAKRWDAKRCLASDWFRESLPVKRNFYDLDASSHEYETRKRNRQKQDHHNPPRGLGVKISDSPETAHHLLQEAPPPPNLPPLANGFQHQQVTEVLEKSGHYDYAGMQGLKLPTNLPVSEDMQDIQNQLLNQPDLVRQLLAGLQQTTPRKSRREDDDRHRKRRRRQTRSNSSVREDRSRKRRRSRSPSNTRSRRKSHRSRSSEWRKERSRKRRGKRKLSSSRERDRNRRNKTRSPSAASDENSRWR